MMSSFSSLIEFVAAIYVTMSLDTLFSKSFWTPDYVKKVEATLSAVGIPTTLINKLSNVISDTSDKEQRKGSLLGILMLMYSVSLLVCIGFEPAEMSKITIIIGYNNAITFSAIMVLLCFVGLSFCKKISFKTILFFGAVLVGISIVAFILFDEMTIIHQPWREIIVIVALLFPILIQLFRNWLYSTIYLKYMEQKVGICYRKYDEALRFNGNEITSIDPKYQNAVHTAMRTQTSQDKRIDEFVKILEKDVSQYVSVPSVYSLLLSWAKYQWNYNKNPMHTKEQGMKKEKDELLNESVRG